MARLAKPFRIVTLVPSPLIRHCFTWPRWIPTQGGRSPGEWAYGIPAGWGGSVHGYYGNGPSDPTAGYTGSSVIGVDINGATYPNDGDYNYGLNAGPFYASMPVINTLGYSDVTLNFKSWLNSDYGSRVPTKISVSNDNWVTSTDVWSTPSSASTLTLSWQDITVNQCCFPHRGQQPGNSLHPL